MAATLKLRAVPFGDIAETVRLNVSGSGAFIKKRSWVPTLAKVILEILRQSI